LAAGLTKAALAERSGLHLLTVRYYETGATAPKWSSLTPLVKVPGVGLVALGFEGFAMPTPAEPAKSKKRPRARKLR
jgi:hypothetical protein